jgi:uncharacterized protein YbbC (DUF1343 family)
MTIPVVRTGLQRLVEGEAAHLRRSAAGLVVHPASVTSDLVPATDALLAAGFDIRALFGPQHGAHGEKQDNMIESGHFTEPATGLPVYSLYSDVRKPKPEMLEGLDAVLFDLQDVGVRVYTFVWSMALTMEACAEAGVRFVVLDRPNPIGGEVQGPVLREEFTSFVGLHPIPLRHGLTCGELARWLVGERGIECELEVVECDGWRRDMSWGDSGLPYVMPSPNLPTPDSCVVYPGMVLLEGTNISEGRGTTRPFELFGAPFLRPEDLLRRLDAEGLEGVTFRPCHFEPTFQKHVGEVCGGAQIHVVDPAAFEPVKTAVAVLRSCRDLAPEAFAWRPPPYEYEETLMPIDILWGHDGLRTGIDAGASTFQILQGIDDEVREFVNSVVPYVLYD